MHLWIQCMLIRESRDQLAFDQFPGLIAVFHALHRLLAPRHPPHALSNLAALIFLFSDPRLPFRDQIAKPQAGLTGVNQCTYLTIDPYNGPSVRGRETASRRRR